MSTNEDKDLDTKSQGNEADKEESLELEDEDSNREEDKSNESKGDERQKESPEARLARLKRMVAQEEKRQGLSRETKDHSKPEVKSSELDYGQKAFLAANGVKGEKELNLVKEVIKNTGKSIEEVLESKYFQADLKEMRDAETTSNALIKGTKRSGQSARDSVEYWIAKGELPPPEMVDLRRQVVNAKMKAQSSGSPFSKNPIVM